MEGFMESFLYLLVTIIILVLSMRKKKPVEHAGEEQEAPANDPFRDIFGDQEDDEYEPEIEAEARPVVTHHEDKEHHEASVPWMSESDAKELVIDADQIMKEASDNNPIAAEGIEDANADAYGVRDADPGVRFNLKKAVIYSEILERRSY